MAEFNIGDKWRSYGSGEEIEVIYVLSNGRPVVKRQGTDHEWAMDMTPGDIYKNWWRVPREPDGWISVYDGSNYKFSAVRKSREESDELANRTFTPRLACVPYYNGQGLEKGNVKKGCGCEHCTTKNCSG